MSYTQKQIEKFANFYEFKIVSGTKTPYTSSAEVISLVDVSNRYVGQRFQVINGARVDTWHFVGGTANGDLALLVTANITQNISPMINSSQSIL